MIIYLASPYTHPDQAVVNQRFETVCRVAAKLMAQGHVIFSPIAHTHPLALAGRLPTDWNFWQKYDCEMLDASGELWVVMMPGWLQSKGVTAEIEYMKRLGRPVRYLPDPECPHDGSHGDGLCHVCGEELEHP